MEQGSQTHEEHWIWGIRTSVFPTVGGRNPAQMEIGIYDLDDSLQKKWDKPPTTMYPFTVLTSSIMLKQVDTCWFQVSTCSQGLPPLSVKFSQYCPLC